VTKYRPHLLVLCVLALVLRTGLHTPMQNALTAGRFNWLPRHASGDIVLVAIDSPSIQRIGVWPWPRTLHAELINRLENAEASDVVFDIDFSSTSSPGADQAFEDALRNAGGSVVLPAFKQLVRDRGGGTTLHVDRALPRFARNAWPAAVNVEPDSDGLVRRYSVGEMLDGEFVPSVGALLAGRYQKDGGPLLIDFGIRPATVPIVSYDDVVRGDAAVTTALKGKKIIVGATAIELGDRINVPNGQVVSGALLQVLAAESLLQGRALKLSPPIVSIGGVAFVVLAMFALWRRASAGVRLGMLLAFVAAVELGALLLQAMFPVVLDTSFIDATVAAYLVAIALDEIDFRDVLGMIAEKRFQQIAMSIGDGLACVDGGGRITLWNAGAEAMFGDLSEAMIGQPFSAALASDGAHSTPAFAITDLPSEGLQAPGGKVIELEGRRKNGETFPVEACFSAWQGTDGLQYGVLMRDISVRKREEERIRYLAAFDTLTGLPNRNSLYEHLDEQLRAAASAGSEIALLMLDLDKFKDINDSLGHTFGDGVLCSVAARLTGLVNTGGFVARLGGDEFAVVVAGRDVVGRAEGLCTAISDSFHNAEFLVRGHRFLIKCSIGVSVYPRDCGEVQELVANADLAMFQAKAAGNGRHVLFDRAIRGQLERRLALTTELERASERGEFELFYQPQIRLKDRKLVGAEALIRWHHPVRGLVSPGEFVSILDTTSVAEKAARWVMEAACRQGRIWQQRGCDVRIGVNLSPSQLRSGDLAGSVAAVLAETGFSAALLELEVTENILLNDDERAREIFRRIRDLGTHIALDDFGTGYASLAYLKKFPLNRLKIDQSFVRELKPGSNDAAIVESTISLSKQLGLSVIAEGIEERSTIDLLTEMGCEEGQGYYFGRPMPAVRFEETFLSRAVPSGSVAPALRAASDAA
jgi:diguanylate cyclase (GGDEF)-like protein/PAS domain S-box-containing protein